MTRKLKPGDVVSVLLDNKPKVVRLIAPEPPAAYTGVWQARVLVYKSTGHSGAFEEHERIVISETDVVQVFGEMEEGKP